MRDYLILGAKLGVITLIVALLLSFTNQITKQKILDNEAQSINESSGEVLPVSDREIVSSELIFSDKEAELREIVISSGDKYYTAIVHATGYNSTDKIKMMVGIYQDLTVTGVSIISQSETPGLGAKASSKEYLSQYVGKSEGVTVTSNAVKNQNEVEAITAATITSAAIARGVNDAIELVKAQVQVVDDE